MYLSFPTFSDGFGLTQLEAQAWKLPIVTTKFCGDVVEDGRNGWILPDVTASAISTTLRRCLAAPAHLQELSAQCTVRQFDLAHIGEQWIASLTDVISSTAELTRQMWAVGLTDEGFRPHHNLLSVPSLQLGLCGNWKYSWRALTSEFET